MKNVVAKNKSQGVFVDVNDEGPYIPFLKQSAKLNTCSTFRFPKTTDNVCVLHSGVISFFSKIGRNKAFC